MAKQAFKQLGENPSRAEEIAFITAVAESIPKDSYLHELFNENFMLWATQSIRDDMAMDLYEFWQASAKEGNDTNSALVHMRNERDSLKISLNVANKTIDGLIEQSQGYKDQNAALLTQNDDLVKQTDVLKMQIDDLISVSKDRVAEIKTLRAMLTAVVMDTGDEELKTSARMLVHAWGNQ